MKNKLKQDLKKLTALIGVDAGEQAIVKYLKPKLESCCDSVEVTTMGTLIARKKGSGDGPTVMLTAHMDEIGFSVKNIRQDGFILFDKVGDYSDKIIPARKITIQTADSEIPGIIGLRSAHVMTAGELSTCQSSKQSYIDVGASTREEVERMGIRIGDKIVIQSDFMELYNSDLVCTRALDDRFGCAILLNIMETLAEKDFAGELYGVFSVMEETTISGMLSTYQSMQPDYVIAVDTVPCGDVPDVNTEVELPVYMGKGPVVIVSQGDPTIVRYSCIHPKIRQLFDETSAEMGIKLQELSISENAYITEASVAYLAGIPSGALAIPRRYSHTPVELTNINDGLSVYHVLMNALKKNGEMDLNFI